MTDDPDRVHAYDVTSIQVSQGTNAETLEAVVYVTFKYNEMLSRYRLQPAMADDAASELRRLAREARRRGFEYPSAPDPVLNVGFDEEGGKVVVKWDMPDGSEMVSSYDPDVADTLADGLRMLANRARGESD